MSFDPPAVLAVLHRELELSDADKPRFDAQWNEKARHRIEKWKKSREGHQVIRPAELWWQSNVIEFVNLLSGSKSAVKMGQLNEDSFAPSLALPLWGPVFQPPSFDEVRRRKRFHNPKTKKLLDVISPESAYIRPMIVLHPYFYPALKRCPRDPNHRVSSDGWQSNGPREVHGVHHEMTAIGYQIRCAQCQSGKDNEGRSLTYCWSLASGEYWDTLKRDYRLIPREIPHFFHRSAVTRDLFDLIIELRLPSETCAGLQKHIEQLHLLHYFRKKLEYLDLVKSLLVSEDGQLKISFEHVYVQVEPFSVPRDPAGYGDDSISDDLIKQVYFAFAVLRDEECSMYLRTLTAKTLSFDHTMKIANKATMVTATGEREKAWAGLFSAMNEKDEITIFRFCQSLSGRDFGESLRGFRQRTELLGEPFGDGGQIIADNCCHVAETCKRETPGAAVGLDVRHCLERYHAVIAGGVRNPFTRNVLTELRDALLEKPASGGVPAIWRTKEDQQVRMEAVFEKWHKNGTVWTAAAMKTHKIQMEHVKKGCLTRARNDLRSDGSRIEGSHRHWNSLQRGFSSGYETIKYMAPDHVLRTNIRVIMNSKLFQPSEFIESSFGCHHIGLVNHIANTWNDLLKLHSPKTAPKAGVPRLKNAAQLKALPILPDIPSGETFGFVSSAYALESFANIVKIEEPTDADLVDITEFDEDKRRAILADLDIDPELANAPAIVTGRLSDNIAIDPAFFDPDPAPNEPTITSTSHQTTQVSLSASQLATVTAKAEILEASLQSQASSSSINVQRSATIDLTLTDDVRILEDPPSGIKRMVSEVDDSTVKRRKIQDTSAGPHKIRVPGSRTKPRKDGVIDQFFNRVALANSGGSMALSATSASVSTAHGNIAPDAFVPVSTQFGHVKPIGSNGMSSAKVDDLAAGPSSTSAQPGSQPSILWQPSLLSTTHISQSFQELSQPVPPPPHEDGLVGLTKSQRLFYVHTGINSASLTISRKSDEFFLFMRLREQYQWVSHKMTSSSYYAAATIYNEALQAECQRKGRPPPALKHPRAILDKLSDVEEAVIDRLSKGDYRSKSGATEFWYRHCHAVSLLTPAIAEVNKKTGATCTRCFTFMYPHGLRSPLNHRRGMCSDGVPTHIGNIVYGDNSRKTNEASPPWPQPSGIFSREKKQYLFSPLEFLKTVKHMYEKAVVEKNSGSLTLEHQAFAAMLNSRVEFVDGLVLFKLYPQLEVPAATPEELFVTRNNCRYLRIDCLREE